MQTIYLDISNKGVIPCIQAKQSEVGRKFLAVITDNGVPYDIPADSLLSVWYEGDTDAGNYSSIDEKSAFSIDGNKVSVELVAQMLLKPGNGELCLSITHGDGGETNTWNIPYCVEYKPGAGSAVPTEYYTALTEAGSVAAQYATSAKNDAEIAKQYGSDFLNLLIPVGYTFHWSPVSGDDTDLSTAQKVHDHFGLGTWEQIKDKVLVGAGDKHTAGKVGGSETHTLTVEEMPSHSHGQRARVYGYTGWPEYTTPLQGVWYDRNSQAGTAKIVDAGVTENSSYVSGLVDTNLNGGGEAFDIMPPYLTVYVWKRIA